MSFFRARTFAGCLLAAVLCVSCSNFPAPWSSSTPSLDGKTLVDAEALLKHANTNGINRDVAAVYQLRAAEIAWSVLDTDGGSISNMGSLSDNQRHALQIINTATEKVAVSFIGQNAKVDRQFSYDGYTYQVDAGISRKDGIYPLAELESAKPAREVKHKLCEHWHVEDGVGVPSAPKWKSPTDRKMQRFVTSRGYLEPITAVLSFDHASRPAGSRRVSLTGYDPTYVSKVKLGQTEYPLAADFTAPIVEQTNDINEITIALTGLIHPGNFDSKLIMLEPYNPKRIPVLLVHGLNSHPRMWRDVINDLRADPKLRGRYQYMLFYYPTGWPISYSSMRLREELAAWEDVVGKPKKMVLIGHSMGGLLSRMQVIKPGRALWDAVWQSRADDLFDVMGRDNLAKRALLFSANPDIGREIYICTPHRGSKLADLSLTGLLIKVLRLPSNITKAFIDLPANLVSRGQLTSIGGLSPKNPLYRGLEKVPIKVPHHSIIGDRGKGTTPDSSDGVVPYWSSHLDSAESELIVPDGHGAYDDPKAIAEMRRILILNAHIPDSN